MSIYERRVFPWLQRLDPETTHDHTLRALELAQRNPAGRAILRQIAGQVPSRPVVVAGLTFPNVLGLAAGFDKAARAIEGLALLGFGHIEVGTLTPRPQQGNPRPRVFRLVEDEALINRMGFPNPGMEEVASRLGQWGQRPRPFVLGVSLGKQKETEVAAAVGDYLAVMRATFPACDYFAVNISSPNTPGLRDLQGQRYLNDLLSQLKSAGRDLAERHAIAPRPIFVKIAPDLSWSELDEIMDGILAAGIDGLIATNTTLERDGLMSDSRGETGGLSGRPLRERSTAVITHVVRQSGGQIPVIGVGGISTAADFRAKLDAGATLVQLYTGLIYHGPGLPGRLLRDLEQLPPSTES